MVNAEKLGAKLMKLGRCQLAHGYLYVLPAWSSRLSVFSKLCLMNALLHFLLLLCQSYPLSQELTFVGRILGLITCAYHGWLSMKTSSEFLVLHRHPNLNPPLVVWSQLLYINCMWSYFLVEMFTKVQNHKR